MSKKSRRARRRGTQHLGCETPFTNPRDTLEPSSQQIARVNVHGEEWDAFKVRALLRHRSIADYLGHLVLKELHRLERRDGPLGPQGEIVSVPHEKVLPTVVPSQEH